MLTHDESIVRAFWRAVAVSGVAIAWFLLFHNSFLFFSLLSLGFWANYLVLRRKQDADRQF